MQFLDNLPLHMDYAGQKKAENIYHIIILLFGIVGFVIGYVYQQFSLTVYILQAGFALSVLLVMPPWPMFRKNPLKWQKPRPESEAETKSK